MQAFGRVIKNGDGTAPLGPAVAIELAPATNRVPVLNLDGRAGLSELSMFVRGAIAPPGNTTLWTINASGGCVPIIAAEIVPGMPRTVSWTYLIHATGTNLPRSLDGHIGTAANVYVVVLGNSSTHSEWAAEEGQGIYLEALDPNNRIPNANAVAIWAPYGSLGITPAANVGVLDDDRAPTAPGGGGGGGLFSCCKCFITNAVCASLGKPDDCFELTTLRFYRDAVLRRSAAGRHAIAEYEDIAPHIVSTIATRPDARSIHERLYRDSIQPAVEAVSRGEFDRAFAIYRAMVNRLRRL
jgi:hypothetical protein